MITEEVAERPATAHATMPRGTMLFARIPFAGDVLPADVLACLRWLRSCVRVGVPMFLTLIALACLRETRSTGIQNLVATADTAVAACSVLAATLFATIPRALDSRDSRGAGRQATIQGFVAVLAAAVLAGTLSGWIAAPPWATVAGAALAWLGSLLMSIRELAASAIRLGSSPDVAARLERQARSGVSIWLVGLAAVGMVVAVGLFTEWYGTDAPGGREAATVHLGVALRGPALALVRLVALALAGYACVGLACWAIVFEVATSALAGSPSTASPP